MFQPAHLLSSVWTLRLASLVFVTLPFNGQTILLAMAFHMIPDIDVFWAKKLNAHRMSYSHAPFFWIGVFSFLILINSLLHPLASWVLPLCLLQILLHLFFDFITARTGGVPLLYPFIKKEYSLFPLTKTEGNFSPFSGKEWFTFLKFYTKNKILIAFELLLCVLGILVLVQ